MQSPMEVDRVALADTYSMMTEADLRTMPWVQQFSGTYDDLYKKPAKRGVHALTQAQPDLSDANREWHLQIKEDTLTLNAFQAVLFETGDQVTSRFHALPGSAQKNFRGFPAIMADYIRWLKPGDSDGAHATFLEAMRQAAEAYLWFRTPKYTEHMARTSNVIQHPYEVAMKQYVPGAPTQDGVRINIIWQTEWLRNSLTLHSILAYATTGIAPTYDGLRGNESKQVFNMEHYTRNSNLHTASMHEGKRSRTLDAGSLHIIDLSKGMDTPSPHKKALMAPPVTTPVDKGLKYANISNVTPAIALLHSRDSKISSLVRHHSLNSTSRKLFETDADITCLQCNEAAQRELFLNEKTQQYVDKTREYSQAMEGMQLMKLAYAKKEKEMEQLQFLYESECDKSASLAQERDTKEELRQDALEKLEALHKRMHEETKVMEDKLQSLLDTASPDDAIKIDNTPYVELVKMYEALQIDYVTLRGDYTEMETDADSDMVSFTGQLFTMQMTNREQLKQIRELQNMNAGQLVNLRLYAKQAKEHEKHAQVQDQQATQMQQGIDQQATQMQQVIDQQQQVIDQQQMIPHPKALDQAMAQAAQAGGVSALNQVNTQAKGAASDAPMPLAETLVNSSSGTLVNSSAPNASQLEVTDIVSNYIYFGPSPEDSSQSVYNELTIRQVTPQLRKSKLEMDANIKNQRDRLNIPATQKMTDAQKEAASAQYAVEMDSNIQLWHNCMNDNAQKFIAYGYGRAPGHHKKMNCCGCGKVQGGWNRCHIKADKKGSRVCPAEGTICTACSKYQTAEVDGADRYVTHTKECCPLNNVDAFCRHMDKRMQEDHQPDVLRTSNASDHWS